MKVVEDLAFTRSLYRTLPPESSAYTSPHVLNQQTPLDVLWLSGDSVLTYLQFIEFPLGSSRMFTDT
ncbi:hypothetical protein ACTXT7_016025 [Hymenolepis weldensis]